LMDGFVHTAEGYAKSCTANAAICSGTFTDTAGQRAMGYYDENFLNYYYYMASQFALSDRWFSPIASKSVDNRIATFSGGTTQGLVKDPGEDHLPQLFLPSIFEELQNANVSWKIYYTSTQGLCLVGKDGCTNGGSNYPATDFSNFAYSARYLYANPTGAACTAPTQASSVVGDSSNSFCIDPTHITPLSTYFTDLTNNTLPSFAFIEAGYGNNDEHPGSGQSILTGQAQVANVINSLMTSPSWSSSVFFFSYDEGGGPYDHVPPVPGHSNDFTDTTLGSIPDIAQIAVNPDQYNPCVAPGGTPTTHCDLGATDPGANAGDAAAAQGFAAQLGFRLPNFIVSPFTRKHYVSHTPMDHTAVIKFVEDRFIANGTHLTARDAAQPNLLEFFDFSKSPWLTPPSPPTPVSSGSFAINPCTPASFAPAPTAATQPASPAN
jgi:phospholipase C